MAELSLGNGFTISTTPDNIDVLEKLEPVLTSETDVQSVLLYQKETLKTLQELNAQVHFGLNLIIVFFVILIGTNFLEAFIPD